MAGYRKRAGQWGRAALVLAVLFASLGEWGFDEAWALAVLSVILGIYFLIVGRRRAKLPDPALMLERAQELAAEGRVEEAVRLLSETVRVSPWFVEAREYLEKIR